LKSNRRTCPPISALVAGAALVASALSAQAADAQRGKSLYESRCAACHSLQHNGAGPAHAGLLGRKAGSAAGFDYSDALKDSAVVWNEATLDKWLSGPDKFIPGQKMWFSIADAAERADIIAYLAAAARR
jgi:cytochrome c